MNNKKISICGLPSVGKEYILTTLCEFLNTNVIYSANEIERYIYTEFTYNYNKVNISVRYNLDINKANQDSIANSDIIIYVVSAESYHPLNSRVKLNEEVYFDTYIIPNAITYKKTWLDIPWISIISKSHLYRVESIDFLPKYIGRSIIFKDREDIKFLLDRIKNIIDTNQDMIG